MQLLIFLVISLVGLWVILWESRPRKLEISPLTTPPPAQSDAFGQPMIGKATPADVWQTRRVLMHLWKRTFLRRHE
jgi:hypothetical protein